MNRERPYDPKHPRMLDPNQDDTVEIRLDTSGDRFKPTPWPEVERALQLLCAQIRRMGRPTRTQLYDEGGHICGSIAYRVTCYEGSGREVEPQGVRMRDALDTIRNARDFHADEGRYPDPPYGPGTDQAFDDWAADLADAAIYNRKEV